MPFWYGTEIGRGFGLLRMLNLPSAPKGRRFYECAALWAADTWWALKHIGIHAAIDEETVQEAFRVLRCRETRWPTPSQFIKRLSEVIHIRAQRIGGAQ